MRQSLIRAMSGMVRRRWWIILQSMVVCGAVLGVLAARNDAPDFKATSVVQIRPDTDAGTSVFETDLAALMAAQRQVVLSASVLDPASRSVGVMTTDLLRDATNVDVDARSGTMRITVSDQDADVAMVAANAVGDSYVSQRVAKQSQGLREEADAIGVQLAELEARMTTLAAQGESSATALAAAKTQYDGLFNRQQDLLTRASLQPKTAEVLTQASSATQKGKGSVLAAMALGALIGLGIGLLFALLREFFDDKVHHRHEVEKASQLPVIAELPFDADSASSKRRSRVSLAAIDRPASPLAEAIRSLRTAVRFLSVESPIRCLTVTSGEPDEGKSLVAANLAVAYAQAGVKTILLSGDLRRPSLDARMLPQSARGFTDLIVLGRGDSLRGGMLANDLASGMPDLVVEAHEVIYRTTIPNLSFVPAGTLPPNPAELLASKGAITAIADLRQHCEMLIIDSPPTVVTDGVILADLADAVLLIAAVDQSHAARISAAVEAVSGGHVRILGVVLNKLHERAVLYQPYGATPSGSRRGKRDESSESQADVVSAVTETDVVATDRTPATAPPVEALAVETPAVDTPVDTPIEAPAIVVSTLIDTPAAAVEEPVVIDEVFTELDVATAVEELEATKPPLAPLSPLVFDEIAPEPVAEVDENDLDAEFELLARSISEMPVEESEPSVDALIEAEPESSPDPIEASLPDESDADVEVADVEVADTDVVAEHEVHEAPAELIEIVPEAAVETEGETAVESEVEPEAELEANVEPAPEFEHGSEIEHEPLAVTAEPEALVDEAESDVEPIADELEPTPEAPVAEEAAVDEPAVAEPEAQEPAVEDPVTEEPGDEEPVAEEPGDEEPVAEEPAAEPEPVVVRASFPPPTTAPMTAPISLEQVRSDVPPPPMPRGGGKVPPPPPSRPKSPPPPPPPSRSNREQNAFSAIALDGPLAEDKLLRAAGAAAIDGPLVVPPPTREIDLIQRREDEPALVKNGRQRDRDLRRLEKEERERQLRLGAELAKARRTMPRGFEARGEVGAEVMAEVQRATDQQPSTAPSTGPMSRAERKAAKRQAKELRLAAKLQAKDQRRKAKAQVEQSRVEAKRAIAEAKAAKQSGITSTSFSEVPDRRTGPAAPPS